MDIQSVSYQPSFSGYVDKNVTKVIDKAVKYAIQGTVKNASYKVSQEELQKIVEEGSQIKQIFNDIVKDAHPKTRLYIEKLSMRWNDYTAYNYIFHFGNRRIERYTGHYTENELSLNYYNSKTNALDPLREISDYAKKLAAKTNIKKIEKSLFASFLDSLMYSAHNCRTKFKKLFNDIKAAKGQKFAEEAGINTDVIKLYNDAYLRGIKSREAEAQSLRKKKLLKAENQKIGKDFLKKLGK